MEKHIDQISPVLQDSLVGKGMKVQIVLDWKPEEERQAVRKSEQQCRSFALNGVSYIL
jgi:hypothetical protein